VADDELSCREVVELVNDYLEGVLPAAQRGRFEEHLDECPGCVTYLDQIRTTVAATRRLTEQELDPAVRGELVQAFREWPREGTAEA
jgi:anti-sigma factor RsiW